MIDDLSYIENSAQFEIRQQEKIDEIKQKKNKKKLAAFIGLLVFFILFSIVVFCFNRNGFFSKNHQEKQTEEIEPISQPISEEEPVPEDEVFSDEFDYYNHGLIVFNGDSLVNLKFSYEAQEYTKTASYNFESNNSYLRSVYNQIGKIYDRIFFATNDSIFLFDDNLNKLNQQLFENVGTIKSSNNYLFVAADRHFIVCDKNLNELSRVFLDMGRYGNKNAHDILIYQDTAYLLDNISVPIFIFRVDIQDLSDIKVVQSEELDIGPGGHLHPQWLNPTLNQWLIRDSSGGRGGSSAGVLLYEMLEGKRIGDSYTASSSPIWVDPPEASGYGILATTELAPIWGVIRDWESNDLYLAMIHSDNDEISISTQVNLGEHVSRAPISIHKKNNYLFVLIGESLKVFEIEPNLTMINSVNLEFDSLENNFYAVAILPY